MAQREEEKVNARKLEDSKNFAEILELTGRLSKSPNEETRDLAKLCAYICMHSTYGVMDVADLQVEVDKRTLAILRSTSKDQYDNDISILEFAGKLDGRITELKNKPEQSNSDLEGLKAQVKEQQETLTQNKETLEDLALLRQKGWESLIKKLEDKKGN